MKGSNRQRSPGSWELTIDQGRDPFGKRRRKRVTVRRVIDLSASTVEILIEHRPLAGPVQGGSPYDKCTKTLW